jgi:hypothetical protein
MSRPNRFVRVAAVFAAWALAGATTWACPICFQIEDGPTVAGVRAAVFVLMGVTSVVLVGFAAFAVRVGRRSSAEVPGEPRT